MPADNQSVEYFIGETGPTLNFATSFTAQPSFCETSLSFSVSDRSIRNRITLTESSFSFAQLNNLNKAGSGEETYPITLIWRTGNSRVKTKTETITLNLIVKNPCYVASKLTWTEPAQTDPIVGNYENNQVFVYDPYTVTPIICQSEISVTCDATVGVVGPSNYLSCEELSGKKLIQRFRGADYLAGLKPGTYTYTFNVSTNPGQADVTKTFTVDFVLEEPCN